MRLGRALDRYVFGEFVKIYGAKGLAYIKVVALDKGVDGLQSPILKFLPAPVTTALLERTRARDGDLIFFGADRSKIVNEALGALRVKIGHARGLAEPGWRPLWVLDFPMFEWNEEHKRWDAMHHPFTSPADGHEDLLDADPGKATGNVADVHPLRIGGGKHRRHGGEHRLDLTRNQVDRSAKRPAIRDGQSMSAMPPRTTIARGCVQRPRRSSHSATCSRKTSSA